MKIGLLKKKEKRWEVTTVDKTGITIDNIVSNKSIPCSLWEVVTYNNEKYKIINIADDVYTIVNQLTDKNLDVSFQDLISNKRIVYEDVYYVELDENGRYKILGQIPSFETKCIAKDLLRNTFKSTEVKNIIKDLLMYKCHIETGHINFLTQNIQFTIYGNYIASKTL